jgi:hypothetical protein
MKKVLFRGALACAALVSISQPALADAMDEVMCPIEKLGDADAEALSLLLAEPDAAVSDQDKAKLHAAVNSCSQEHGWKQAESERSLQMNLSMISALGIDSKLMAQGIEIVSYEALLENKSAGDLRAFLDKPEGSPILNGAVDKLKAEQGDSASADTAGYIAAYLVHMAQVQLLTMEAMGLAE